MTSKKSTVIYLMFCLWVSLQLGLQPDAVLGARVAGEEGVTSTSDQIRGDAPGTDMPRETTERPSQQQPESEVKRTQTDPAVQEPATTQTRPQPVRRHPSTARPWSEPVRSEPTQAKQSREEKPSDESRFVTIDFDNVDISLLIKFISELTGKNFIIDKAVRGNVTIISPTKISVNEAYKVFESVLEINGFTTVEAGSVTKIVSALDARAKDIETRIQKEVPEPGDRTVTQLIPLKYADPEEIRKIFTPFISKSSIIVSYPPTGMLIVTDFLSNIRRLLHIIDIIDVEGIGEEITVIQLEHATSTILAKSLSAIFQQTRAAVRGQARTESVVESSVKIIPDERTNSLVLVASENDTAKIKAVIKLLDRPIPRGEGDIHVYYLQNSNAEDLTNVLMSIPSKGTTHDAEKGKAPILSQDVQIVADKATNALVITARRDDYLILEDVIKKLDIPRPMVYIEALIMEVSLAKDFNIGVEWQVMEQVGTRYHKGQELAIGAFGASRPGISNLPSVDSAGRPIYPSGFTLGVLGEAITIAGVKFPSIAAVINAFQYDSDVNILSTPQIMTINNEEAEIVVADNIPFLTRMDTTTIGDINYSNYEYKDVGVTLKITPQINRERFVRLKIFQEVSDILGQQAVGLPTTLKRKANTTVIVKDGHTVVIGGLINETVNRTKSQVPCLGSMVGLGALFRASSDSSNRTNLFIFLTPHIVENPIEAEEVFLEKKGMIEWEKEASIKLYQGRDRYRKDMQLNDKGYVHLLAGDYARAGEDFKSALEINPENPYVILNMGVLYERQGHLEEAISMYEKVIELDPRDRAAESTDTMQRGRRLVDIAADNLRKLKGN